MVRNIDEVRSTTQMNFLTGHFKLMSDWRISYLSCSMDMRDLAESLKLASELPGAEQIHWRINELYQRDIDWERVQRKIVKYLLSSDSPQFFNALTVALLPYDARRQRTRDSFRDGEWSPPNLVGGGFEKTLHIGPISLGFWDPWETPDDVGFQSGQVRWNTDEVFPVAIDGQHRLAAFKEIAANPAGAALANSGTRVPVIFLLFDSRFGYEAPPDKPTVEVLRQLFIDLNKHAATVSRARQILLDDRDPYARCVRQVVAGELQDGASSLESSPPRIPLSLVDWHSEQAKFDDGPCLTTILGLDQVVTRFLDGKLVADMTAYGALNKQIDRLQDKVGVDLSDAKERLFAAKREEETFSYSDSDLNEIDLAFAEVMSGPIVELLTKFQPYSTLIKLREDSGSLSLDFQYWYQVYRDKIREKIDGRAAIEYGRFLSRMKMREVDSLPERWFLERLTEVEDYKKGNLAFNVVYQRALIEAFIEFEKLDDQAIAELEERRDDINWDPDFGDEDVWEDVEPTIDEVDLPEVEDDIAPEEPVRTSAGSTVEKAAALKAKAKRFVSYMNVLVESDPATLNLHCELPGEDGTVRLWQGTLRKPGEGTIDFSQAASRRAGDLIFMAVAMKMYDDHVDPTRQSDFDHFWSYALEGEDRLSRAFKRALNRWCTARQGAGYRIVSAREEDPTRDAMEEEARARCAALWSCMSL